MKSPLSQRTIPTPLGEVSAWANIQGIVRLTFDRMVDSESSPLLTSLTESSAAEHWLEQLETELSDYFKRARSEFKVPLHPEGTRFQQEVWSTLREIPYGETLSYGQLAQRIQRPKAVRAVANANSQNPICILIPCHRVIGTDGSLTGYRWGLDRKQQLLTLEQPDRPRGTVPAGRRELPGQPLVPS